jgi:hypothetical protein
MKKNISMIMLASAALCVGLHPANANLLGMPINLKVAIERSDVRVLTPARQFYTDHVLSGPLQGIADNLGSANMVTPVWPRVAARSRTRCVAEV